MKKQHEEKSSKMNGQGEKKVESVALQPEGKADVAKGKGENPIGSEADKARSSQNEGKKK